MSESLQSHASVAHVDDAWCIHNHVNVALMNEARSVVPVLQGI